MAKHDEGYKSLFSHSEVVRDLLTGFVHEDWIDKLDMSTLEKANSQFISEELLKRDNDILWRVRYGEDWIYVYILLEFQSTPNNWMALRILSYICLLYQDLLKNKEKNLTRNGKLPPVFPMVLYNGEKSWNPDTNISILIDTIEGDLSNYLPSFRYVFLDEEKHGNNDLQEMHNLTAAIFNLEQGQTPEDIANVVEYLVSWLKLPQQASLSNSIAIWIKRVLSASNHNNMDLSNETIQLQEIKEMLAERVKKWPEKWLKEGEAIGEARGKAIGETRGKAIGEVKGKAKLLIELLEKRFQSLSEEQQDLIFSLKSNVIASAIEYLFQASSLDEIFEYINTLETVNLALG